MLELMIWLPTYSLAAWGGSIYAAGFLIELVYLETEQPLRTATAAAVFGFIALASVAGIYSLLFGAL